MLTLFLEIKILPIRVREKLDEAEWGDLLYFEVTPVFLGPELEKNDLPSVFNIHGPNRLQ